MSARFELNGPVRIAVVIVTYNNRDDICDLLTSLRAAAHDREMRVVVADNDSQDGTPEVAGEAEDVVVVRTGGNLGYAGGINAAVAYAGEYEALLVLNPDLRIDSPAIEVLWRTLCQTGAGIVAPRIVDSTGRAVESVFREPSVLRSLGDALLGPIWSQRPSMLSERVRGDCIPTSRSTVDWVSGAALLISADAMEAVGEWDERFFLYSEETDYCRRARDRGFTVMFEPAAVVMHRQGGSGTSAELAALQAVNRVRYVRKHSRSDAWGYRMTVIVGELLRHRRGRSHSVASRYLRDQRTWSRLPRATWHGEPDSGAASIVIPAHNEAAVMARTLASLAEPIACGAVEVIVSCNGCADNTADIAREYGAIVIESQVASKPMALNAADQIANAWPRIYLDADIELPSAAIPALLRALREDHVLAGRPPFEYDTVGATFVVKAYYRARQRIPELSSELWGAGVYALTAAGHAKSGPFPALTADDLYVNSVFARSERSIPPTVPVRVRTPRHAKSLIGVLRRARRGAAEQGVDTGRGTFTALRRTALSVSSLVDAAIYAGFAIIARAHAGHRSDASRDVVWERDDSSR